MPIEARASVDEYSIGANASLQINLEICSSETQLAVQGDAGTDLDFTVADPSGMQVHSDQGVDDYFSIVVDKNGRGCGTFNLGVTNLGEEANTFQVVLEPITESSTRVEKYIIQGNQTQTIDFKACGTSAQLQARGDGDTDLDFIVRNSDGAVVHENDDTTDETSATLAGLLSDCETFEMDVSNLGEVYNAVMVVVAPEGADEAPFAGTAPSTSLASGISGAATVAETEGAGEYRADANSALIVNLPVCGVNRLEVRGDGDTDLDFTITDSTGSTVHSDFDLSDVTITTLAPSLEECETFAMEVSNLGDVYNVFSVALTGEDDLGGASGPGEYRVAANGSNKVVLRACTVTTVYARGDGDTDLDFTITDGAGSQVHSDFDLTDQTEFEIDPGEGCADFQMAVSNLGEIFNVLTVTFDTPPDIPETSEPAGGGSDTPALVIPPSVATAPGSGRGSGTDVVASQSGAGQYRAPANATITLNLPICEDTFVTVEGDGDTDLDFLIRSSNGDLAHSDYDLTDVTFATLSPSGSECETFTMEVENLGDVFNIFTVEYSDDANSATAAAAAAATAAAGSASDDSYVTSFNVDVPDDTISTDGNNRNIAILNRTGEALNFIYWSNSATLDWGDDKLGDTSVLASGQQWNVYAGDASFACLFDFKAITETGREIVHDRINVCEVTGVAFR